MNDLQAMQRTETHALRQEIKRLETMHEAVIDAGKALVEERDQLRAFIVAHTRLEAGVTDFDLHHDVVEQFRATTELPAVRAVIAETLAEAAGTEGPEDA